MSTLILNILLPPNPSEQYKVENIDLESKVDLLKAYAVQKCSNSKNIELLYAGAILDESFSLSYYGIKSGVTIHVVQKPEPFLKPPRRKLSNTERTALIYSFKEFGASSRYRSALQKMSRPETLEKIIAASPGLNDDIAAIAFIHDPELMLQLADDTSIDKIFTVHPSLIEATLFIKNCVYEDTKLTSHNQATTSTGYSYSLEALSDDDDDMETSDTPREANPLQRNTSFNAITAAQLAAAIANASTNFTSTGAPINAPSTNSSNIITNEMFGNALQQAFAAASPSAGQQISSPVFPNRTPTSETGVTLNNQYQSQLQQMREMGLSNEGQNIRALQATNGDVQAAIDLVFNGVID